MMIRNVGFMKCAFVIVIALCMPFYLSWADSRKVTLEDIEAQAKEAFKNAQQYLLAGSGNQNVLRATQSGDFNFAMNAFLAQERENRQRREKLQECMNQGSRLMKEFGLKWCELLSKENGDVEGGRYMTLKKFNSLMKNATTAKQMIDCHQVILQQRLEVDKKFEAMEFMAVKWQLISLLNGLCFKMVEYTSKLPEDEQRIYVEYSERLTQNLQQMTSIVSSLNPPSPMHLTPVDTSIKLPKRIRSTSHCAIHGCDYDLAQGCPGCKGNVDFGSGKLMHCNIHNVNYDSRYGCTQCTRPR